MVLTDIAKCDLQEALKEKAKMENAEYRKRFERHKQLNRVANEMMAKHGVQPLETEVDKDKDHEFELIKNVCKQKSNRHRPYM